MTEVFVMFRSSDLDTAGLLDDVAVKRDECMKPQMDKETVTLI